MSSRLKSFLRRAKGLVKIAADYTYDARRYFRYSSTGRSELGLDALRARLYQKAHSIEKGLAMPDVRRGFGEAAFKEVVRCLKIYERKGYDRADPAYRKAIAVIKAYVALHGEQAFPPQLAFIRPFEDRPAEQADGGAAVRTRSEVLAEARADFASVVASRHSIRMFADRPVDRRKLESAIGLAARSPSVCNRQGGRTHLVERPDLLSEALRIQGGNRGFSDQIKSLLVVTESLPIFRDGRERNQAYVDGGLFAMTLLYALHYVGLGACPLNWSADRHTDRALRKLLDIPADETIIVLVGVGELREEFRVARSPRRGISDILHVVE